MYANKGIISGMNIHELTEMHNQESVYWWHIGRRLVLTKVLRRFFKLPRKLKILDVGCGTGINFTWLKAWGEITGLDSAAEALDFCRAQGSYQHLLQADAGRFVTETRYDLVTAFDVLEHLEDDAKALTTWHQALADGGYLYLTVPAYQWLFGAHDRALLHFRRYTTRELKAKLERAGFRVQFISPFFTFTFPIVALVRLFERGHSAQTSYRPTSSVVSKILVWLSSLEASWLSKGIRLPFGSSILVVAKKAESRS